MGFDFCTITPEKQEEINKKKAFADAHPFTEADILDVINNSPGKTPEEREAYAKNLCVLIPNDHVVVYTTRKAEDGAHVFRMTVVYRGGEVLPHPGVVAMIVHAYGLNHLNEQNTKVSWEQDPDSGDEPMVRAVVKGPVN
jgi:hypothetical protein